MTASIFAKSLGCKSLEEVSEATGQSRATLRNWFNNKPELFKIVCLGVVIARK